MLISLKTEYGIKALVALSLASPKQLALSQIAKEYSIPAKFLERILNDLRKGGIVESSRGKNGGYSLAQSDDKISLLDVVECLEGGINVASGNRIKAVSRKAIDRGLNRIYQKVTAGIERDLRQVSLLDLAKECRGTDGGYNYHI
jgi:Rrf2 family protein